MRDELSHLSSFLSKRNFRKESKLIMSLFEIVTPQVITSFKSEFLKKIRIKSILKKK